jgi:hypothetical protein
MVVIPKGLLEARKAATQDSAGVPSHFADDPVARREIELAAMEAVMTAEMNLGNVPTDVSAQKIGYDIASYSPASQHLRFIDPRATDDGRPSSVRVLCDAVSRIRSRSAGSIV